MTGSLVKEISMDVAVAAGHSELRNTVIEEGGRGRKRKGTRQELPGVTARLHHFQEFDYTVHVGVDPGANRKSRPDWQCLACWMLIDRSFVQSLSRKKKKKHFF